jgi:hypothetical protein
MTGTSNVGSKAGSKAARGGPGAVGGGAKCPLAASDPAEKATAAKLAVKARQVPEIRWDLVARVMAEIEAGTYETEERIETTVDRLVEELFPDS